MKRPEFSVLGEPLAEYVEHFRHRVIQDAVIEATATYWRRRADQFDRALPRVGDYAGHATPIQVEGRRARIAAIAEACRHRAEVALITGEDEQADTINDCMSDVEEVPS